MARPETQDEHSCELASIAVDPCCARRGVGKVLVGRIIDRAREMNATKLYLTTDAENNDGTNAFYRGLGFRLADVFPTPRGRLLNEFVVSLASTVDVSK